MVAIEIINYTFFIVGHYSWQVLYSFTYCAIIGILFTHAYRVLIKKRRLFTASLTYIWLHAFIATLVISVLIMLVTEVTFLLISNNQNKSEIFSFVSLAGFTVNWMRYIGVWVIIYFMYNILQQHNAVQREKLVVENLAKTTELELLKLQLNPHFLFNALNSIKALVMINPEQSRDAIVKLSELLRFTLQYGKESVIPLHDELQEVQKYLALEQMRFGSRLQVHFNIDENTLSQTLPPATLLTLAENAIKHGIAKQMGDGFINVTTKLSNQAITITVSNTGIYNPENNKGIGLSHITKRLEDVYNSKAIFEIFQQNNYVTATLNIPVSWQ